MAGSARYTGEGPVVPSAYLCAVADCQRHAVASCFECERFCCEHHLTAVSLLTTTTSLCVHVCPACLHRYQADPEIQPLLTNIVIRPPVD